MGDDAFVGGARTGRLGRVDDRIVDVLGAIDQGTPADRALGRVFKNARDLGARERHEVSETVYGVVRAQRRIDDTLQRAAKATRRRLHLLDGPILTRLRVLAWLAEQGMGVDGLKTRDPYAFKRVSGLFERIVRGRLPEPKKRRPEVTLAVRVSLPDWMALRLLNAYGPKRAEAIGQALSHRAPLTLRVNRTLADRATLLESIPNASPTQFSPDGITIRGTADVSSWPLYKEGKIEIQDEASQLAALALGASEGETILDACSGAGGKTLALGAAMGGSGRITALDVSKDKIAELKKRARRAGLTNIETVTCDLIELPDALTGKFDRVLVDAPCTTSGVFRRSPDARWRLTEADVDRHVARQLSILIRACDAVRPGGVVAYVTCSILAEENEHVVRRALAECPSMAPRSLRTTWGDELCDALNATHHAHVGPGPTSRDPDGFYVALLAKAPSES
jgi:16S rRNA (cytosine967-C5)-methyltransferase